MPKVLLTCLLLLSSFSLFGQQGSRIYFDGFFTDWPEALPSYTDNTSDGTGVDLLELQLTHDEDNLYIHLKLDQEIILQESYLALYIDTDNNPQTGDNFLNGIGADLYYHFGNKAGMFYGTAIRHTQIRLVSLPTHSSSEYEIAIKLEGQPDNLHDIFASNQVKLVIREEISGGDYLPDNTAFSYTLAPTSLEAYEPVLLEKEDPALIRITNYNVLFDSPMLPEKQNQFIRIMRAINPDIIAFNEFFNSTAQQVKELMDNILPTGTPQGWNAVKIDRDNVTLSRYPILNTWLVRENHNLTATEIRMPNNKGTMLVINTHMRCCSANRERQLEADALAAFINDAKTNGGRITIPLYTPIVVLGDMNLVGDQQQLVTLLTGDIQNKATFGSADLPDWGLMPLADLRPYHSEKPWAFTWRDPVSQFAPGRLDFMLYTSSNLAVKKSFILNTERMTYERQQAYILDYRDSRISDHLPLVADFSLIERTPTSPTGLGDEEVQEKLTISPNPFSSHLTVQVPASKTGGQLQLLNLLGTPVWTMKCKPGTTQIQLPVNSLEPAVYILHYRSGEQHYVERVIKQ